MKAARKTERELRPLVKIRTREDADLALKEIGRLQDRIASVESREREVIRQAEERMVGDTAIDRKWLKAHEKELERWAWDNCSSWPSRTLMLNFGRLFFRLGTGAISFKRSKKWVLDRIKAKKLLHLIRHVEEPDKDALGALDDAALRDLGCRREKPDYFHYEVKREEVK